MVVEGVVVVVMVEGIVIIVVAVDDGFVVVER